MSGGNYYRLWTVELIVHPAFQINYFHSFFYLGGFKTEVQHHAINE
jgi:hypothetical protein